MLPKFFLRSRGLGRLYTRMFTPLRERHGLTQTEADILLFLANNPAYDTARDIVEKRHLTKSHISAGIDALVNRGLLERHFQPGNRKVIHLRLTEAAAAIIEEGRAIQRRYGETIFAGITEAEQKELVHTLDHIAANVDAALAEEESRI